MDFLEEFKPKNVDHWAVTLRAGDRCIATIRHKTDGTKNIIDVKVIVISNNIHHNRIRAYYEDFEYHIPYNDLKPIQICYKTNTPCKYNCQGLCRESY